MHTHLPSRTLQVRAPTSDSWVSILVRKIPRCASARILHKCPVERQARAREARRQSEPAEDDAKTGARCMNENRPSSKDMNESRLAAGHSLFAAPDGLVDGRVLLLRNAQA